MFFDRMEAGKCYALKTAWGTELVKVLSVEADCVCARGLIDGRRTVYSLAAILAYTETAAVSAPCEKAQPPVQETPEPAAQQPEPPKAEKPQETEKPQEPGKPEEAEPAAQRPSSLLKIEPGERVKGKIALYFAAGLPGVGNGYIELPLPEDAQEGERAERVFFHARQVREKQLCDFLSALPRIPDFNGRARGFQLSSPVEVTFVVADNRAHSTVGRPVAGDVRMTEEGARALRQMAEQDYRFIKSGVAFVDGYRFSQGHELCCQLTVQQGENERPMTALLYEENIADPRLRRYLMETRPRVPDGVKLKADLFRRLAGGRPVGPMLAAHVMLDGDEKPWTERDEMRWEDMFTEEDREKWAAAQSEAFDAQSFALKGAQQADEEENALDERESEFYEELPLWEQKAEE